MTAPLSHRRIDDMRDLSYLTSAEAEAYAKRRAAMMGEWPGPERFNDWLARKYPEVQLTEMQQAWVAAQERGEQFVWGGGKASGKTFVLRLWERYQREHR